MTTGARIASSAFKHGVSEDDMLHAYRNPVRRWILEEDFEMIVGPDRAGNLTEVGLVRAEDAVVVVHAMPARRKFLR